MPIIDNNAIPLPEPEDGRSARRFVNKEAGAANVTVGELVMQDGAALRLHTHPTDEAIILLEGQVEMIVISNFIFVFYFPYELRPVGFTFIVDHVHPCFLDKPNGSREELVS